MNKKQFIDALSKKTQMTKVDSEFALNSVISCITDLLAKGDSIILPGFASIKVIKRAARKGRNPATGKTIQIAASKSVSFRAGTKLKHAINK